MEGAVLALRRSASRHGLTLLDDARLARAAGMGDRMAAEEIYSRHGAELHRCALGIVRNRQDAEDVVQTTMMRALAALREGSPRRLKPWLVTIARNEALQLLRHRVLSTELTTELPGGSDVGREVLLREQVARLVADLEDLPARQRSALVLRELYELGYPEIGTVLGVRTGAARQAVHEARRSLVARGAGRDSECGVIRALLDTGDGRHGRSVMVRAHLEACAPCRRHRGTVFERGLRMLPIPEAWLTALFTRLFTGVQRGPLQVWEQHGAVAAAAALTAIAGALGLAGGGRIPFDDDVTRLPAPPLVRVASLSELQPTARPGGPAVRRGTDRAQPGTIRGAGAPPAPGAAVPASVPGAGPAAEEAGPERGKATGASGEAEDRPDVVVGTWLSGGVELYDPTGETIPDVDLQVNDPLAGGGPSVPVPPDLLEPRPRPAPEVELPGSVPPPAPAP